MLRGRFFFPLLFVLAAVAAACGGGRGVTPPAPTPSPTPHPGPTNVPVGPTPQAVLLSGGGYTLSFTVPPIVTGNTSTMNAVLQTTLPSGTVAPQTLKHHSTAVRPLAQNFSGMVYLIVSTKDDIGFSSAPSFTYTMPAGTTIASGSLTYILYWDPAVSNWVNLLGPGTVSGQTVTFPSVQTGIQLSANTQYIYALAQSLQPVPTASPAPTPTVRPTTAPTASPTPASVAVNCNAMNYSPPSGGGIPLHITDDSGVGAALIVYVKNGGVGWLAANGGWNATPNPLPAACFSTTKGASSTLPPLIIPYNVPGGRIYFAYATPVPSPNPGATAAIPNPFAGVGLGEPNVGYTPNPYPWDKIEFGTIVSKNPVIDTTQVDALALPLELSVSPNGTPLPDDTPGPCVANPVTPGVGPYGVTSCKFAAVFNAIEGMNDGVHGYQSSVFTGYFNSKLLDLQVVSPQHAGSTSFDWNMYSDASVPVSTSCPNGGSYLSCVLASYASTPRLFTSNVSGAGVPGPVWDNYCAGSDGSSNFLFTDVGTSTSCNPVVPKSGAPAPNPFKMPLQVFTYGTVPNPSPSPMPTITPPPFLCQYNLVFSQPFGTAYVGPNELFANSTAFAMWKALVSDLNLGTALNNTPGLVHPIGPPLSQMFQDPLYNVYDKVMHDNFNGGFAYGIAYDDQYGLESGTPLTQMNDSINVRINPIPAASSVLPGSAPTAVAAPNPCPSTPPGIGSY